MVSHGKPLRLTPSRTKAQRRSPLRPCHDTSVSSRLSLAIDLTGYRHNEATRPTSRAGMADRTAAQVSQAVERARRLTSGTNDRHHAFINGSRPELARGPPPGTGVAREESDPDPDLQRLA